MAKKSKQFVIATEGATVDGRTIERAWIEQMAAGYNPATYTAGINIEHIRSALPDSPFKNYGVVDTLTTRENADGKLQLLAAITPTGDLVKLVASGQKLFTSMEVNPKFADTGKAYLVGLAVTDTPASLGTDMLEFTASKPEASPLTARKQHKDNHFSASLETVIEFEDVSSEPGILERVRQLFARKEGGDAKRFADVESAIEELAEHGQTQSQQSADKLRQVDAELKAAKQQNSDLTARLTRLEEAFANTPSGKNHRPMATGDGRVLTDF